MLLLLRNRGMCIISILLSKRGEVHICLFVMLYDRISMLCCRVFRFRTDDAELKSQADEALSVISRINDHNLDEY